MSIDNTTDYLVWLDLEMTGLSPDTDLIIEIATAVTDLNLNIVEEGPSIAIATSDKDLQRMSPFICDMHKRSGLITRIKQSSTSLAEAEQETLEFLKKYVKQGYSPICGNSICLDRRFIVRYMPHLADYFHYRNLDVSSLKILAQSWGKGIVPEFKKQNTHRAIEDVRESIAELKYYREIMMKV